MFYNLKVNEWMQKVLAISCTRIGFLNSLAD